ncbi:MAG: carboxynorspermidine decarboxylase, partial [Chitinophagaceae bacterium]
YDPCAPCSRMGITTSEFERALNQNPDALEGLTGLHFHTLCQKDLPPLRRTLKVVEDRFGKYFPLMSWINFGGGHHISREDYQVDELIKIIKNFSTKYSLQVYLEPGEAVAIRGGVLVTEVLDIFRNEMQQAILDTSATCHMPDVLEMPYRPDVLNAGLPDEFSCTYRLGGMTCLSGDIIGDYSFTEPLKIGQRLVFDDMAHYTMVKTTTFNGINLPAIALWDSRTNDVNVIREFGYNDFKMRLS